MLYILIAIIALLIIGAYFIIMSINDWDSPMAFFIGLVLVACGGLSGIIFSFSGWDYLAAEHKAKLINEEFGTQYTQEEVYWGSDVIDEIHQLQRKRVEVNGNVMGHGEDPNKE